VSEVQLSQSGHDFINDAAKAGLEKTNSEDSSKGEYHGFLVRNEGGAISPTDPKFIGTHGGDRGDAPPNAVGEFHNHPTGENFSGNDFDTAQSHALQRGGAWSSFIRTPSGALKEMEFRPIGVGNYSAGLSVQDSYRTTPGVFEPYRPLGYD
jgi:hypothetical protein